MGNLKDIQDITGLTSEAIFNIRKPIDYMCSDSDVDSYFEDIRSRVENLRDWGGQWKILAKDLFDELMKINNDKTINAYLSYEALEKIKEHFKNQ